MLSTQKPSASAVCPVLGVIPQIPKKLASWRDSRYVPTTTGDLILNPYYYTNIDVCFEFAKGKPPTKKAKVLQKQPLMAKLAAYAQYQASQQNQPKSKAGMSSKSSNDD